MKRLILISAICFSLSGWGQQSMVKLENKKIIELVKAVADSVETGYVFPDKGIEIKQYLLERVKTDVYQNIDLPRLVMLLRKDLLDASKDKHLSVRMMGPNTNPQRVGDFNNDMQPIKELKILDGNVGYIRFDFFPQGEAAMNGAMGAMLMLNNTDALIIDMRYNGGGHPLLIEFLCGMFLPSQTHINSIYFRKGSETITSYSATSQIDYQVFLKSPFGKGADTLTVMPGFDKLKNIPIYVLTSSYTFSAAEEFTYNLQSLKRATVIGETTGGGAHPVRGVNIAGQLQLSLPFARSINPITKTNWQDVGVRADVSTSSDEAMGKAHVIALENLYQLKHNDQLKWDILKVKNLYQPYVISETDLMEYVGKYADRQILIQNGQLTSQREGQARIFQLKPLEKDWFELDGQLRLHFVRNDQGQVFKVQMRESVGIVGEQIKSAK